MKIRLLFILFVLFIGGCRENALERANNSSKSSNNLTVSAAADLTPAFTEIGRLYEQQTGTRVNFNFGSTGQLTQQIEQGAPVDVFAAANVTYIDELE